MLFHTLHFAVFFLLVLFLYVRLDHRWQNRLLLAGSYYFYGCWDWRFLSLLLFSTAMDYWFARVIAKARAAGDVRRARWTITGSVVCNLTLIGVFKYYGFFVWGASRLLETLGLPCSLPLLHIVLPVGISFYTFQSLSYTIDVYRGDLQPADRFEDFALFVSFFPQLVAGPIERATHLLPQVLRRRTVTVQDIQEGAYLFVIGLLRKVVVADSAGVLADLCFGDPAARSSLQLVLGLVLYGFQIYGDFAGYSDMARGCARLMGFTLMRNFRHPYFAANIADFWHRWHISLSTWLRDYLYISLGGNRGGRARTYRNLLLTMLLGGLWHGAHWTFVLWGGLHGFYLVLHRLAGELRLGDSIGRIRSRAGLGIVRGTGIVATFAVVLLTWLPFRVNNIGDMLVYLKRIAACDWGSAADVVPAAFLVAIMLAIDIPQAQADDEFVFLRAALPWRVLVAAVATLLLVFSFGNKYAPFIYFQF